LWILIWFPSLKLLVLGITATIGLRSVKETVGIESPRILWQIVIKMAESCRFG
jgi:hypothetical protein